METKASRLQEAVFKHLDAELSSTVKKKLGSTGAQEIVTCVVNFISENQKVVNLSVLLDPTSQVKKGQRRSVFEPVEEPEFIGDLANLDV